VYQSLRFALEDITFLLFMQNSIIELLDTAEVHKDLAADYAPRIRNKLVRIETVLIAMAADNDLLNPSYLLNNFKKYRGLSREVQLLEAFPLPVILRYSGSDHNFYKLCCLACEQIAYPLPPPVVSTISTEYYWAHPTYRLVAVPLCEEFQLLSLPDLYHELAHFLYAEYTPYLQSGFMNDLDKYIEGEKQRARNEHREKPYLELFEKVKFEWKEKWIVEFICDMIATYLVGPAYGWANLRLSANSLTKFEVFGPKFDQFLAVEHPSDEARMRGIYTMLRQLKHDYEIKNIDEKWQQYISLSESHRPVDYVYFHPDQLLDTLAQYVLDGCKNIGLISVNEQLLSNEMNLVVILNAAWQKFIEEPESYPDWERAQLQEIYRKMKSA
jgi:hypothetical protein